MAETVASQDNILPGAYINFLTNAPLVITSGNRGVVLLQKMSVGAAGEMYTITAMDASQYPADVTNADKLLANEAFKGAPKVVINNLGSGSVARETRVIENAYTIWNDLNTLTWQQVNSKTWNELKSL